MIPHDRRFPSHRGASPLPVRGVPEDGPGDLEPRGWTRVGYLGGGWVILACLVIAGYALWSTRQGPGGTAAFTQDGVVAALAFAPDGRTLASVADDGLIRLWDAHQGRRAGALRGGAWPSAMSRCLAFDPSGETLAVANPDSTVVLWDLRSARGEALPRAGKLPVLSVAFSPDGATLAANCDEAVRLWDVASGEVRATHFTPSSSWVLGLAFSPDGGTLAASDTAGEVTLWDVATGRVRLNVRGHGQGVRLVEFSRDGTTLATAGADHDHAVRLWDAATGRPRGSLRGHEGRILALASAPDRALLASASIDRTVRLWDPGSGREVMALRGHTSAVKSLAFSGDGATLASGDTGGAIRLWDARTGRARVLRP